jgi:ABC-type iron transport system FetAB permease component
MNKQKRPRGLFCFCPPAVFPPRAVDLYQQIYLGKAMALFFVGIVEMIIVTVWTKFVTDSKIIASGGVTMVNIVIWYYVLQRIIDDLGNWQIVLLYAFGCAIGTMLAGLLFKERPKTHRALSKHDSAATLATE